MSLPDRLKEHQEAPIGSITEYIPKHGVKYIERDQVSYFKIGPNQWANFSNNIRTGVYSNFDVRYCTPQYFPVRPKVGDIVKIDDIKNFPGLIFTKKFDANKSHRLVIPKGVIQIDKFGRLCNDGRIVGFDLYNGQLKILYVPWS